MSPSLRLVRRACAYAYARLFRFRSAAGPAVVWQTAAGVNRALGAGLAAGKALVCGPDVHRRKRKHERGMRFRFITASSVSGRPFSGVFPPCRGGMLERKKAPSPAGAPALLFCAPSRTALPRPMQRRSPPLCPFSLCPCVRQPTTAVDHACAHAVPQSACVSASRRSVPGPMGRRRPLSFPEVLFVPAFSSRPSCAVHALFRPPVVRPHAPSPSASGTKGISPARKRRAANACVRCATPCLFRRLTYGYALFYHRTLLSCPSPFLYRIPSAAFAFPRVIHPSIMAVRHGKPVCPPHAHAAAARGAPSPARPSHPVPSALFFCCFCTPLSERTAPLAASLRALRHLFRPPRFLCRCTPLLRVCPRCAVCFRAFYTPRIQKEKADTPPLSS